MILCCDSLLPNVPLRAYNKNLIEYKQFAAEK